VARQFGSELVLTHVIQPVAPAIPADPTFAFTGPEEFERTQEVNAEDQLTIAVQRVPSEVKSRKTIGIGDSADEITRIAAEENADLIVIATHGLTGWRHLIFGSVAEKVIRSADRPVLVIPSHGPKQ